jgi:hypothetical protein
LILSLGNSVLTAQTVASPSSSSVKFLPKKPVETKKETSDYSGMKDPSLKELHLQFFAGIRTYLDQSLNDPNAAGYAYHLNFPVTNLSFSGKPVIIPGGTQGIIQAIQ